MRVIDRTSLDLVLRWPTPLHALHFTALSPIYRELDVILGIPKHPITTMYLSLLCGFAFGFPYEISVG